MDNDDMLQADALPATKGDIKALAAGIEARFATKDDLKNFATKADFEAFKRDAGIAYAQMKGALHDGIAQILGEFASFRAQLHHLAGDAVSTADFAMRGQTILGHRVDELEKRVTLIESKPERPS